MPQNELPWQPDWRMQLDATIHRGDELVLGKDELELLRAVDRWRSISEAARQLGRSYRWTWMAVQRLNEAADEALVQSTAGGKRGGGASLTPRGKQAAAILEDVQSQLAATAAQILRRLIRPADATTVHLAVAVSMQDVVGQLVNDFALIRPDATVRTVFGASNELADHLLAGSPGDAFISADAQQIDRLIAARRLQAKSRRIVARNSLALATPATSELVLRKPARLKSPSIARVALASPDCPLGRYSQECLTSLGLDVAVRGKSLIVDNSRGVLSALRAGQADAGLAFASDAVSATDLKVHWRSAAGEPQIECHAALSGQGKAADVAAQLLAFICSAAAAGRWRQCGFAAA